MRCSKQLYHETKKNILIVGAGSSGLVAARVLARLEHHNVTIREKDDRLGGVWNYIPKASPYSENFGFNKPEKYGEGQKMPSQRIYPM